MSGSWKAAGRIIAALSVSGLLLMSGCTRVRLPAIDPTGSRIFLPAPAATTLASPLDVPCRLPAALAPAWTAPPTPPPCDAAVAPPPLAPPPGPGRLPFAHQGRQPGQIILTPTKVVAPINSEVVLLSGLCRWDGYFATHETIQWMLSPDSVGQFLEVGQLGTKLLRPVRYERLGKLGIDYAVARTSSHPHLLTRGTATPVDDVLVRKGQSWASVSSPTEGTSYVTVLAPEATAWDQRRQTATIYWIDAQWSFPSPAIVPAGQNHLLTTTLSRLSTGQPLPGWTVRYTVHAGAAALFTNGQSVVEVMTDATGRALAELVPQAAQPGATQVHVQIIRPEAPGQPAAVVGEGFTTITWSAPGLAVVVTGPEIASVGSIAVYNIEVSNPGDLVTRNVTVTQQLPPGLLFIGSNPPAQAFGDRLQWNLGDLSPKAVQRIQVETRAELARELRYCARAEAADNLVAEGCASTRIFRPALAVSMSGPQTAEVGQAVTFQIDVTNTGDQALSGVLLIDRFDPGLRHSEGQLSPVEFPLGDLQVGQTVQKSLTFIIERPGRLCHTLEVVAAGGHSATTSACVEATAPAAPAPAVPQQPEQPQLEVRKTGPEQVQVGNIADFQIDVSNLGNTPATGVRVVDSFSAAFRPSNATPGFDDQALAQGQLVWGPFDLPAGHVARLNIRATALQASEAAENRVTVTTAEGLTVSDAAVVRIIAAPQEAEPQVPAGAPGVLRITIAETADPLRVGQTTTYLLTIHNDRQVDDQNVNLSMTLPEGLRFTGRITGPIDPAGARFSPNQRVMQWTLQALRPGDEVTIGFDAEAQSAGTFQVEAQVDSFRSVAPQSVMEETTIFEG